MYMYTLFIRHKIYGLIFIKPSLPYNLEFLFYVQLLRGFFAYVFIYKDKVFLRQTQYWLIRSNPVVSRFFLSSLDFYSVVRKMFCGLR